MITFLVGRVVLGLLPACSKRMFLAGSKGVMTCSHMTCSHIEKKAFGLCLLWTEGCCAWVLQQSIDYNILSELQLKLGIGNNLSLCQSKSEQLIEISI